MNTYMKSFMDHFHFSGLTFDDVSLVTQYSEVLPKNTDLRTRLTDKISLNIPFISAAMDTVTEWKMAVAMAKAGGIGIIHKNMSIQQQAEQVGKVKKFLNGFIENPYFYYSDQKVYEILKDKKEKDLNFSSFPVVNREDGKLCGIMTSHDLKFVRENTVNILEVCTKEVITAEKGIGFEEAYNTMLKNRIGKLPVVDKEGKLTGLYCLSDIKHILKSNFSGMNVDRNHQLVVGAAVSPDDFDRVEALVKEKVDVVVVDTAHGHSIGVIKTVKKLRELYKDLNIIAGNIATGEAALDLYKAGANAVKVGIGPGSICTTRVIAGVGVPQISAIYDCYSALMGKIPVIADGGIRFSGDVSKALAAGAECVMMGSVLAGTEESPGEKILYNGRKYVLYRGMGSLAAMKAGEGSRKRYFQDDVDDRKLVPEGIEGMVPFSGNSQDVIDQYAGGIRASLGYCGSENIIKLHERAKFVKVSVAGLKEAHPHDVSITKEAPNYKK